MAITRLPALVERVTDMKKAIPKLRESVVAILGLRMIDPGGVKDGQPQPSQFRCSWGSGFCVVNDRYVVTAFHVLNEGKPRDPEIRFYAIIVPNNDDPFFYFPVIGFPVENQALDIAVLEIGACSKPGLNLPAASVSFAPHDDGTQVITMGFPSPEIAALNADPNGNFLGGQFFLKSHANEGIIAAHYNLGPLPMYELNVGWHHGESGGPIGTTADRPIVISLMQQYRNIQGPHGILPGPRRGIGLSAVQKELESLGVIGV